MDNLTLGYTFDKLVNNKFNFRIYTTMQNVFVITKYRGIDPEIGNSAGRNAIDRQSLGIDNNVFPRARTFIFGLNLGF